jgi:hypothetical protein
MQDLVCHAKNVLNTEHLKCNLVTFFVAMHWWLVIAIQYGFLD